MEFGLTVRAGEGGQPSWHELFRRICVNEWSRQSIAGCPVGLLPDGLRLAYRRRSTGVGAGARPANGLRGVRAGGSVRPGLTLLAMKSRSEEHTSELQSLMRITYAGLCLK